MSTAELASSYAALILADDGVDITVSPILRVAKPQKPSCAKLPAQSTILRFWKETQTGIWQTSLGAGKTHGKFVASGDFQLQGSCVLT